MADVKLVDTPNVPPKWEPFVVVTLSKAEAWLLASVLGSSSSNDDRAMFGLYSGLDNLLGGRCLSLGIDYEIPEDVLNKYKEMGGA